MYKEIKEGHSYKCINRATCLTIGKYYKMRTIFWNSHFGVNCIYFYDDCGYEKFVTEDTFFQIFSDDIKECRKQKLLEINSNL